MTRRRFRDRPIRQKLILVVLLTTTISLLLSAVGVIGADFLLFRRNLERDLSALCRIIGDNSAASLEFDEPRSATEMLAALKERPHIAVTCIYRINGTVLANYVRAGSPPDCPPPSNRSEVQWKGHVTVSQPIMLKGKQAGTVVMLYDLGEATDRAWLDIGTVLGVLLVSSIAAFFLSAGLREMIATPISELAEVSRAVSATKDYSLRAERHSSDETGLLVDAFNEMLSSIQAREEERERIAKEKLATEELLRQTAKLESLGVLAGGIAHDFNNLLVGMLGNASLVEEMLPTSSPILPLIQDVVGASEKAAQLTHQMLAYSGKGRFIINRVDLSTEVESILPLISRPIPKSVTVHLDLEPNLPPVEADKSQLQQILMNLVINAAEACGTQPGSVFIRTCKSELDDHTVPSMFGLAPIKPGTYVAIEVKDTGSGMSEEVRAKIFDPFFTTKFTGRGLGLAAVLGIIRSHHGGIEVESTPGQGTTFRVYFPAATGSAETDEAKPPKNRESAKAGTVLVVDDEAIVRATVKNALERNGYQVILAEDGEIGVQKFKEFSDRISAVILDLTMPVLDGEAALAEMQKIDPYVKVLLSSGFDRLEIAERFKSQGLSGFLQKPYTTAKLTEAVRAVLENG